LTVPSGCTITLPGFRSRCTIPAACAHPQSLRDLPGNFDGVRQRQRAVSVQPGFERLPRVQRHCEEQPSVGAFPDLVDGAEVRVIERRGRTGFPEKALLGGIVQREMWVQELQSDRSAEAGVLGAVHDAHAAGTERLEHAKVGHGSTGEAKEIRHGSGR